MFQGTVPRPMVQKLQEEIKSDKNIKEIYIACSGNFTYERSLYHLGLPVHSNDIGLYTTMLGDYFSGGEERKIELSDVGKEELPFLCDYIKSPVDKAATALCLSNVMNVLYPRNMFEERTKTAYFEKWDEHHTVTKEKLLKSEFRITQYHCEDFQKYMEEMPEEGCALGMFPPTYKAGYEKMFKNFSSLFEWDQPEYEMFDPDTVSELLNKCKNNRAFLFTDKEIDTGVEVFRYVAQGKRTVHLYENTKDGYARLKQDELAVRDLKHKLFIKGEIEEGAVLSIKKMDVGEFNMLRTMYLNKSIFMKNPSLCFSVCIDGKIIGAFGVTSPPSYMEDVYFDIMPYCYLLSDFPIICDVKKLAKLIVIAAMSKEAQHIIQASFGNRIRNIMTTAFTSKDVSMKYRGLFTIHGRLNSEDKDGINYVGPAGCWTLEEGLKKWREIVSRK